jgi:ABC-2 type transport system permease protein
VAEVLVTTVRPAHLLAGKVLGIGATTLLLVLAAALPFAGAIAAGMVDVPEAAALDVLASVGWFALGYSIYAMGFAALGALVDRQEDLGGAIGPVSAALVLSYFASFQAQGSPDSTLAIFTSIFPLSAPMVMPVRIAEGAATPVQVLAAIALGLATLALLARVGETIYRRALLRGGRRLKLLEVLRG